MKKLILIFVMIISASAAEADNNPFQKFNLKINKLSDISRKPPDLSDKSDIGCDLCGCYMGLEPNFSKNSVGVRYSSYKFYNPPHNDAGSNADHPSGTAESTEYYDNIDIYFRYYINPKFRILATIPYSFNTIDTSKLNGFGDLVALAQYQIYNTNINAKTNFWQRIFLGGGFKFPTGVYNKSLVYWGEVEPHFQPGTGSLDFMLSGLYIAKLEKTGLGWRNDLIYTITTKNKNGYRFSNRFNIASTFTYEIDTKSLTFLPHSGIYYETAGEDTMNGEKEPDSGGNVLFGTAGLDMFYGDYSLDFNYSFPLSEKLNGDQAENKYRFFIGLGFAF